MPSLRTSLSNKSRYTFLAAAAVLAATQLANATNYTWTPTGAGPFDWNDIVNNPNNWGQTNATFPSAAGDVANVTATLTAAQTINLNVPITVGIINVGSSATGLFSYNIMPNGGSLSMDNAGAGAQINQISTSSGDTIAAPISIVDTTGLTIANAATGKLFTLSGDITGTGNLTLHSTATGGISLTSINLNNVGTVTNTSTLGPETISALIGANVTSVTQNGAATLSLSNAANAYTGPTVIETGTLNANTFAAEGSASSIGTGTGSATGLVFGGGTLQHNAANVATTNRTFTIGDAHGLTATIDSSGATTNTLSFTSTAPLTYGGSGARTLTLTGSNANAGNTFAPEIDDGTGGATSVVKTLGGTWTLTNTSNSFSGGVTISTGTLIVPTDAVLGTNANVTINNAAPASATLSAVASATLTLPATRGVILGSSATSGGSLSGNGGTIEVDGIISGLGILNAAGGTVRPANTSNSYSGGTKIGGGTLSLIASDGATTGVLGAVPGSATPGNITFTAGATLGVDASAASPVTISSNRGLTLGASGATYNLNAPTGKTLVYNGAIAGTDATGILAFNGAGSVQLGGNSTFSAKQIISNSTGNNTISGNLTLTNPAGGATAATATVAVTGAGTLLLSGTNSFSSTPTFYSSANGSMLSIASDAALGTAPVSATKQLLVGVNTAGATIEFTGTFTLSSTRTIGVGQTGANQTSAGSIGVAAGQTVTFDGVITGNGANSPGFTKSDSGTLILGGVSTYGVAGFNPTTSVTGGTLQLHVGDNRLPVATNLALSNTGTFDLNGFNQSFAWLATATSGTLTNSNNSTLSTVTITSGKSTPATGGSNYGGAVTGNLALLYNTSTNNELSGGTSNTYTGGTTVMSSSTSAPVLSLGASGSLGTGPITVGSKGTIDLNGFNQTVPTLNNPAGDTTGVIQNRPASGTATLTVTGAFTYDGTLTDKSNGTTNLTLDKEGTGVVTLTNTNNAYHGGTVVHAGTLNANTPNPLATSNILGANGSPLLIDPTGMAGNSSDAVVVNTNGSIGNAAAVTVNTNSLTATGTLNINAATQTIGSLAGTGSVVLGNSAGTVLTVGVNPSASTIPPVVTMFSGVISQGSGVSSLIKQDASTLILTGANTYTGNTTITGGGTTPGGLVLGVGGSIMSPMITVGNNAASSTVFFTVNAGYHLTSGHTFAGFGIINSDVVTDSGSHIAPGSGAASTGTLTFANNLTLSSGSVLDYDFGAAGASHAAPGTSDITALTGTNTLTFSGGTGSVTLNLASGAANITGTGSYEIFNYGTDAVSNFTGGDGVTTGTIFLGNSLTSIAGVAYTLVNDTTSHGIFLDFAPGGGGGLSPGSGTWKNGANDGLWTTNTGANNNWAGAVPGSAADQVATFDDTVTNGPGTVDLNGNKTVGGLVLNTATNGYTIGLPSTANVLTMQTSSGDATITVGNNSGAGASHTINAPMTLASNTDISLATGTKLTLAGAVTGAGNLSLAGSGILIVSAANNYGTTTINGSTLGGSGSIAGAVTLNSGGRIFPSAGLSPTSATTLTVGTLNTNTGGTLQFNLITPGSVNDQIVATTLNLGGGTLDFTNHTTGAAGVGYYKIMQYTTLTGSLSSMTLPATANSIAYFLTTSKDPGFVDVHRGYLGDANDSGFVDLTDLTILASNWQHSGNWNQGDFDGSGFVDLTDLTILAQHWQTGIGSFGQAAESLDTGNASWQAAVQSVVFAASVPEPTSLALLGLGAAGLLARRRRR